MPKKKKTKKKVEPKEEPVAHHYVSATPPPTAKMSKEEPTDFASGTSPSDVKPVGPKEAKELEDKEKPKPTDMVKVQVVFGSVTIDDGTEKSPQYTKGDVFEVSRERAENIDPRFVKILG